jgi:L-alanine-DL-glutamate epimerase-like enolase superfamily enzyme
MKIARMEWQTVKMRLEEPYAISYDRIETTENLFLRLETDTGLVGWGCAAPEVEITGETPQTVNQAFQEIVEPRLLGGDPLRQLKLLELLRHPLRHQPSALAAVDLALQDLLGKAARLPLWKILGGYRESIVTSFTLGILPLEETVEQAKRWAAAGFRCLKIKGGLDPREDAQRVLAVRRALGTSIRLRFDANQGYDMEGALQFVELSRDAGVELLEQPTHRRNPRLMGRVTGRASIPIMADESLLSLRDAFRIARHELADMINIKLMKVGGIAEAVRISNLAAAARLDVMVGCMDEAALGVAAGVHLALARPNITYADLDGHLGLLGDPSAGAVILENGELRPTERPGLGFDPRF